MPQGAQIIVDLLPQFFVRSVQKHADRHAVGLGIGAPIRHLARLIQIDESAPAQQHVHLQPAHNVHLPVVGEDDEVGVVPRAGGDHRVDDLPQPAVGAIQRRIDIVVEDAVAVAHRVEDAVVYQQQIRLIPAARIGRKNNGTMK